MGHRRAQSDYCSQPEDQSTSPLDASEYIGSITSPETNAANAESNPIALSYADQRRCAHNLNLIALFGDQTPDDDSIHCDSKFCGTQIVGTGRRMADVLIDNKFTKLNAIRADRLSVALPAQLHRAAVGVQLRLRAGDRRVRASTA